MKEVIQVEDQFYILATSPRADDHTLVLKHGETFAVFDHFGDIRQIGMGEEGIYHEGTRHLNRLRLLFNEHRPLLLSSTVRDDNALLTVDLTNPDIDNEGHLELPRDTIHIFQSAFLWRQTCFVRLRLRNYETRPIHVTLALLFDADFADIFEVRGMHRSKRGERFPAQLGKDWVELSYRGLDQVVRRTRLQFSPLPSNLSGNRAQFDAVIPAHGSYECSLAISCNRTKKKPAPKFETAFDMAVDELTSERSKDALIETSNEQFNAWMHRSAADLHLMLTHTEHGPYPYAGVPWFSTAFGRDGLITALECLWINPEMARGVLTYLAATQASELNPDQDAEPGKILHETRKGEMAALGEIPFGQYYGTVDATPLFVVLAAEYYSRTADRDFVERLWPNIERALEWIDQSADSDGDGFFEYARHAPKGLTTQGWKDSFDSVFHEDGSLAEGPVALCEVQGYVYAAWKGAARLADVLGKPERGAQLRSAADALKQRFDSVFWCEDLSTYALALDGNKQPCCVRTSNAGHCLFSGIATPEKAERVTATLLDESSFSGWGVRTVATHESRYNPMAYHNGSIWPHDNALIALGMAKYGFKEGVLRILDGMFEASRFVELNRMPELFCGFPRRTGAGPTLYPVACAPQSWAAGAVFMLFQACLGLSIDGTNRQIRFNRPLLPQTLRTVNIRNLKVLDATVDLSLQRHANDVGINLVQRTGDVEILIVK